MQTQQTTLIDIKTVKARTGFRSTQSIYNLMNEGRFPLPISVGARTKRWVDAEVELWIQERIAESRLV